MRDGGGRSLRFDAARAMGTNFERILHDSPPSDVAAARGERFRGCKSISRDRGSRAGRKGAGCRGPIRSFEIEQLVWLLKVNASVF